MNKNMENTSGEYIGAIIEIHSFLAYPEQLSVHEEFRVVDLGFSFGTVSMHAGLDRK